MRVLLVSFLRDYAFWKDGAGRLVSTYTVSPYRYSSNCSLLQFNEDLPSPDLIKAFSSSLGADTMASGQGLNLDALTAQNKFCLVDGLSRLFLAAAPGGAGAPAPPGRGQLYLASPRIADVARTLNAAVDQLLLQQQQQQQQHASGSARGSGKVVLVLDQPDMLLAAAGDGDGVTSESLRDVILGLRDVS